MEYIHGWILLMILTYINGYDRKCPHPSQWDITSRSYRCSDQKDYICLLNELESSGTKGITFTETCGSGKSSREGYKYVLKLNLYQVPCAESQYQPFFFTTDGNSQCVFSKSLCKASGQVLSNNGGTFTDRSCRCDYRMNYDYVIPPKDPCSCKPAEEDCSCYIKKCDDDKVMVADYRCMKRVAIDTILPEDMKCPIISRIIPPERTDTVDKIQLQSVVTDSYTLPKQASVIMIVVVLIFTVLIGFLFYSVPQVKSISLKSKLELYVTKKENEFMLLKGDNVKIECLVTSYISARLITWQKEIDGEIIQINTSVEKSEMDFEKRPSLTINNFNAADQGKYRCIVRNAIGLRNEMFVSCMNLKSRFGWLTGFVTVLQHIPAFHTVDITLHSYDIESQSKPTVCNVHKGDDITIKQQIDQQKILAVKWFKESDIWTELDISSEQYSGGTSDVPSLTIKITKMENAGKYICLLRYDNGETQKSLFKLKIKPEAKFYKALCEHRVDKTFLRPAICDTIVEHMQEDNLVVISGREGTGKSKICLELASLFEENDYMVMKIDLSKNHSIYTDMVNTMLIIDDPQYNQESLNTCMKHLLPVLLVGNNKVFLTCRNLDLEIVRKLLIINKLKDVAFIDINNCLTAEEKEKLLRSYMKENNIATSTLDASNFRDPEIVTDFSIQVTVDDDTIKVISNEEPWNGFPLCASSFCSEKKCLHLGEKYFTNPPQYIFEELRELYENARNSNSIDSVYKYCILVYIMNSSSHQLDLNDPDLCRKLVKLCQTYFQFKYLPEKPGLNEDQKIAIEKAADSMKNKYLKLHEDMYMFVHPCLSKAMFLSSDYMVKYLLEKGSFQDLTEFVRSKDYPVLENELIITIEKGNHHILCERLVRHAFEDHKLLLKVAKYIKTYWRSSGDYLIKAMFSYIEFIFYDSLGIHTDCLEQLDDEGCSDPIKLEGVVKFSNIIELVSAVTIRGQDPWIYGAASTDFLILSGLLTAAIGSYAINQTHTLNILLSQFQHRIHSKRFEKLLRKPLDIYENTFFHCLSVLRQEEVHEILFVNTERKFLFDTENVKKYTPLDIAAYLGKIDIFKFLNLKTSNCTNKLRVRLKELAKSGKVEYYKENSKSITFDQQIVHKTEADSALPEKLEYGNADDEKKDKIDEGKHKLSNKKKELKRKEKNHDKMDVLYFEDFMINIVVNGKKEDYESIIQLFSK